jgi:hypothetical protein
VVDDLGTPGVGACELPALARSSRSGLCMPVVDDPGTPALLSHGMAGCWQADSSHQAGCWQLLLT